METKPVETGMSRNLALRLCEEERLQNRRKWFTAARWQCWGCITFSKGEPDKMCFSSKPDFSGCALVNRRYERRLQEGAEK